MGAEPNLALLRTFLVAYRSRSMTKAAAELGISQPGVTAQIRNLEAQLRTALFHRTRHGLVATAAADELATRIGPHIDAVHDALGELLGPGTDPFRRTVLFGGPAELTALRVLPTLADLFSAGLRLRVHTGQADDLLRDLTGGALDLVVSTVRPRSRSLTAVPIADEEFALVAAPVVAERLNRDRIAAEHGAVLSGVPLVAYSEEIPIIRRYWRHVFGRAAPQGTPAVLVADLRAVATACAAGAGYSVLPTYLVRQQLASGELLVLHQPDDPPINTFHLAWRSSAPVHAAVAAVRAQLQASASDW